MFSNLPIYYPTVQKEKNIKENKELKWPDNQKNDCPRLSEPSKREMFK